MTSFNLIDSVATLKQAIDASVYEGMTGPVPRRSELNSLVTDLSHRSFELLNADTLLDTRVLRTPLLPGWVVKTSGPPSFIRDWGGIQNAEGSVAFDSEGLVKRPQLANRMRQVVTDDQLDRLAIPKKHLCTYPEGIVDKAEDLSFRRFFVIAEEMSYFGTDESVAYLASLPEAEVREIARQICVLIRRTGFCDLHMDNFGVARSPDRKIVLFDTEPMRLQRMPWYASTHRCARVGLQRFAVALADYAHEKKQNYPFFDIFKDECRRSIASVKIAQRNDLITLVFQALSCLFILPIFYYAYQYHLNHLRRLDDRKWVML